MLDTFNSFIIIQRFFIKENLKMKKIFNCKFEQFQKFRKSLYFWNEYSLE